MEHVLNLSQVGLSSLNITEATEISGGQMTLQQLIWAAWVNTPDGGSSFWQNMGGGYFDGTICYNGGCPGNGGIDTNTGFYFSRWPGLY